MNSKSNSLIPRDFFFALGKRKKNLFEEKESRENNSNAKHYKHLFLIHNVPDYI